VSFDEVYVVAAGDVAYLPPFMPMCFDVDAWNRVAGARYGPASDEMWRTVVGSEGCQWSQEPLTLEFLAPHGRRGARVRLPLMTKVAWVFIEDLQRP
jgi:hypothetical protein